MATLDENIRQANSDFNAIKAKIIEKGVEIAEGTKTEEYAVKVGAVYEKGRQDEYNEIYESVIITQDCTNVKQCFDILSATNNETDKIVMFINKKWNGVPDSTFADNTLLYMIWVADEFRMLTESAFWMRWRAGAYSNATHINTDYDCTMFAGDEFVRVVIL